MKPIIHRQIPTISQLLKEQTGKIDRLDAELLLAHALRQTREYLLSHPEKELSISQCNLFYAYARRRQTGEPIAYILGNKEFLGFNFIVDNNVLIPRPETEILIESILSVLKRLRNKRILLIDLGTGSGCIAIAIAKQIPQMSNLTILASDISQSSLLIAKKNARRHRIENSIRFVQSNLLKNKKVFSKKLYSSVDSVLIVANLPYVSTSRLTIANRRPETRGLLFEPRIALDGGRDGLAIYTALIREMTTITQHLKGTPLLFWMEINPDQSKPLKSDILKIFPQARISFLKDLRHQVRCIFGKIYPSQNKR